MPDPEEIPENTMAFSAGNFPADTGIDHICRNPWRPKLAGPAVYR